MAWSHPMGAECRVVRYGNNEQGQAFGDARQQSEKIFATHRMAWSHPMGAGHRVVSEGNNQ